MTKTTDAIYLTIHAIPAGRVCSYGRVAEKAGLPGCARLVGQTLRKLPKDTELPWHRVVLASGKLAFPEGSDGYRRQYNRLKKEGVILNTGRIDMKKYGY